MAGRMKPRTRAIAISRENAGFCVATYIRRVRAIGPDALPGAARIHDERRPAHTPAT